MILLCLSGSSRSHEAPTTVAFIYSLWLIKNRVFSIITALLTNPCSLLSIKPGKFVQIVLQFVEKRNVRSTDAEWSILVSFVYMHMCREGVGALEQNAACLKFLDQILPEAFRKLLTSNATSRWLVEIQVMLLACYYFSLKFWFPFQNFKILKFGPDNIWTWQYLDLTIFGPENIWTWQYLNFEKSVE